MRKERRFVAWVVAAFLAALASAAYAAPLCNPNDTDGDGISECSGDCAPNNGAIFPDAPEVCDDIDNQCPGDIGHGTIDEGFDKVWYQDVDGDTYGDPSVPGNSCDQPPGFVQNASDCDDGNAGIHPGAFEACDATDNDCSPVTADGAGEAWLGTACDGLDPDFCTEGVFECTAGQQACSDTTGDVPETCNGVDDDCDPASPDGADEAWLGTVCDGQDADLCAEGSFECTAGQQACSDATGDITEACNGLDDDCDGAVPGGERDDDGDNFRGCEGDCDDATASIFPGAAEICGDGTDNDCNGTADDPGPRFVDAATGDDAGNDCFGTTPNVPCATIQHAVDVACANDTINVAAGTYPEIVNIGKSVHLIGAGAGATSIGPLPGPLSGETTLVAVSGSTTSVEIAGLAVRGPSPTVGPNCTDVLDIGIHVRDGATANIHDLSVLDIREGDPASAGCQSGAGILVGGGSDTATATIADVDLAGYQKSGIVVAGPGSSALIERCDLQGGGADPNIARNGVQVSDGATATVRDNDIEGHQCDAAGCGPDPLADWQAGGVLIADAGSGTLVERNRIDANDMGVYVWSRGTTDVADNTLADNRYAGLFLDEGTTRARRNVITGATDAAVVSAVYVAGLADTVGDLQENVLAAELAIRVVKEAGAAFDNALTAANNDLSGMGARVQNDTSTVVDVGGNWWGDATPAGVAALVSSNVDYTPWLDAGTDLDLLVNGFQGSFAFLHVAAASPQVPPLGRVQEGIERALAAGTVKVHEGTYGENARVGKPLTLLGDPGLTGAGDRGPAAGAPALDGALLAGASALTGLLVQAGDVTVSGLNVLNFGNGITIGYENTLPDPPGGLPNIKLLDNRVTNVPPTGGLHGFGIYAGYQAEDLGTLFTQHLDYAGLEIARNVVSNTGNAGMVIQSLTSSGGALTVADNEVFGAAASSIWVDSTRELEIRDNLLRNSARGLYVGCYASSYSCPAQYAPDDVTLIGNVIREHSGQGIWLDRKLDVAQRNRFETNPLAVLVGGTGATDGINNNAIVASGAGTGIHNDSSAAVDANCNWWGSAAGPGSGVNVASPGSVTTAGFLLSDDFNDDLDTDTYASCTIPGYSIAGNAGDCDNQELLINPGRDEACNGVDDNCVAGIDETGDALCDDALHCTGIETCVVTVAGVNEDGCVAGTAPNCDDTNGCTHDSCDELLDDCLHDAFCTLPGFVYYAAVGGGLDVASADGVPGVTIAMTGDASGSSITNAAGAFAFDPVAGSLTLTPQDLAAPCPTDPYVPVDIDAVGSADASLIARFAVGLDPLSDFQKILADVSNSSPPRVSSFDASLVAQKVSDCVGKPLPVSVANGSDWAYTPVSRAVSATSDPVAATEFLAGLYGDVDESWDPLAGPAPSRPARASVPPRTAITPSTGAELYLARTPRRTSAGWEVVLGLARADGIVGLDMTLAYDPAVIAIRGVRPVGLASGLALVSNDQSGTLRMALYGSDTMVGTGEFLVVTFEQKSFVSGLPFTLQVEANEGSIPITYAPGLDRPAGAGPAGSVAVGRR